MTANRRRTKSSSWLYGILRPIIKVGTILFFRRIEVKGIECLPRNAPVLLVANHQNAMLDPVVLGVFFPKQLHWLTRSDVFVSPGINSILGGLNMLPVYRERDRARVPDWSNRNEETFATCHERWRHNAIVSLFPEGSHRGKKQLHVPLKKGAARLVYGALRAGIDIRELSILPVGLDYSDFYGLRGEILVRVGEAIQLTPFIEAHGKDEVRGGQAITSAIHEAISAEMIDIHAGHDYDEFIALRPLCDQLSPKSGLNDQFEYYQKTLSYLNAHPTGEHIESIRKYAHGIAKLELHEEGIAHGMKPTRNKLAGVVCLMLCLPIYAVIRLVFAPIEAFIEWFVSTRLKDPLFYNSIRVSFWTFLGLIWGLALSGLSAWWMDTYWAGLAMLAGLFVGAVLTLKWGDYFRQVRKSRRFSILRARGISEFTEWWNIRSQLVKAIINWNEQ